VLDANFATPADVVLVRRAHGDLQQGWTSIEWKRELDVNRIAISWEMSVNVTKKTVQ
jgi:hypothetical protein